MATNVAIIDPIPNLWYDPTRPQQYYTYYRCTFCGQWVNGSHYCAPWQYQTINTWSTCDHCFCIDVPPSGVRTKPHVQCCHCGRIQVVL